MKDFSKYLKDGRRVAAFGQQIGKELEVFLLYCSRKDHFSKKWAKFTYDLYLSASKDLDYINNFKVHPVVLRIPIIEGNTAEYTFKTYMNENFYRKSYIALRATRIREYLYKYKEQVYLKGSDKITINKL